MKFRSATDKMRTSNHMRDLEKAKSPEAEKKAMLALFKDVDKRLTNIEDFLGKP